MELSARIFLAHARLAIEAVQAGFTGEADQVAIALFVLRQHQQVVVLVVGRVGAMILRLAYVQFASQNRLDALGLGRVEKVNGPVDVPVVRHRDRLLSEGRHAINELVDVAGAVKEGVFGMKVEVGEFGHGPIFDFSRHVQMGKRSSHPEPSPLRKSRLKSKFARKSSY